MTRTALVVTAVTALGAAACSVTEPQEVQEITGLPRALTVSEERVIRDSNAFGLRLAAEITAMDDRANIVLSPLSASMALGMTLNGADGSTFDDMRTTLGFDGMAIEDINASYASLIELLTTLDPAVRLDIANAVWTRNDVPFHEAFRTALADAFGATTESRDFADPATLREINAWVDEQTEGYIDRILDTLDPDLVALLLNAVFFDGPWTFEFDPADTAPGSFHVDDATTVTVDMMSLSDVEIGMGYTAQYGAVELPYGGGAFSMVIVVPNAPATPRSLLASLDAEAWAALVDGLRPRPLDLLTMPKLAVAFDGFLDPALRTMGMDRAFRPGADFSRMSPVGDGFCIDFVRQKTFVEVDERGTRAAAVTAVGIRPVSFNGLIVDRPFVLAIRERFSGTILFLGLIGDPTAEDPGAGPHGSTCG